MSRITTRWRRLLLDTAQSEKLRTRLLSRASASREAASHFVTIRSGDGLWRPIAPGVRVKQLSEGGEGSVLLELSAGAIVPPHRHRVHEECFVLRGGVRSRRLDLHRGDYHLAPAGSRHPFAGTAEGALLLLRGAPVRTVGSAARSFARAWIPGDGPPALTLRSGDGPWDDLAPGIQGKGLWRDGHGRSALLRIAPGASTDTRLPDLDEEAIVVDGEAFFGDILLSAGDYQRAAAGAPARAIASDVGALVYTHHRIRTA